ncbi:hypothetical protein F4Z99_12330 [Candidatus Poribacteria bacterium]|nr:hypothetical protein [Candidatus Poribacteria bacterium]MYB01043.1 hypothetical protein [Candidatus Poribacteria bacterium]
MSQTEKDIDQQTNLKMEKAIRSQMETLIPEMQKMADNYNIAGDKSPYRNVLNVAVDPASDVEVTKNFILYQLGRDQRSPWRNTDNEGKKLGLALVDAIKKLDSNAKLVVKNIGRNPETDKELVQQAHRRLMQLYLGNLVRYQVYLTFKAS